MSRVCPVQLGSRDLEGEMQFQRLALFFESSAVDSVRPSLFDWGVGLGDPNEMGFFVLTLSAATTGG